MRGEHRGGQANPLIWPMLGAQAEMGAVDDRPISARCRRTTPPILVKSPPANSRPFGPSRSTNTERFAPGFHLPTTPPREIGGDVGARPASDAGEAAAEVDPRRA